LIEGRAFDDLRSLVVQVLAELEQRRFVQRRAPKQEAHQGGVFTGFDLSDLRELVGTTHPKDLELLAAVESKQDDLERRIGEAQEVLARYRRLATLGQLIDSVLHNGRTPLAKLRSEAELAVRDLAGATESTDKLSRLRRRLDLVVDQSAVLAGVFRRIEPFGGRKTGRPSTIVLEDVIAQSFEVLRGELDTDAINVRLPGLRTMVTADPTEIQEIFVNLITNSIYWLERVPKDKRAIAVDVRRQEDYVEFQFSDSGPGVDPRYRDQIFEPYFSMKTDGVGLGLTLAGEIIKDYYGGELELMNTGSLPGATFRGTLRRRI
jgi:C4-dicarboxylate-specific signal transduction histidine kinase